VSCHLAPEHLLDHHSIPYPSESPFAAFSEVV
jgi:hypothetical protein